MARRNVPVAVREAFQEADQYFPTPLQKFQFFDKYSRYRPDLGRRETWVETVDRASDFLKTLSGAVLDEGDYQLIRDSILHMEALPAMRLIAMAGPAAWRDNTVLYNCSFLPVDCVDAFVEALLISMAGGGVGFSVEDRHVSKLPRVKPQKGLQAIPYLVEDSAQGWGNAVRVGIEAWFEGYDIAFDYSQIRLAGAVLTTKGGRASGPGPLRTMLSFARDRILRRQSLRLRPLDAHDIMCAVGNAAVSGGMRRTAMLSLFDFADTEMRNCKNGDFERDNSQRWNANNSAVWPNGDLDQVMFLEQMLDMVKGGRGEPGIFNRQAAIDLRPDIRKERDQQYGGTPLYGINPCGEVILRPNSFCNLSISVARPDDTEQSLQAKVRVATIIGTIQSMATYFPDLRPVWKQNCEEERLLGVDITGQRDCKLLENPDILRELREIAVETNRIYAERLGINQSSSVTVVKPSGNSSQLLNCSSGLHARWAPYYERNIRVAATSPIFKVLRDAGVPMDPENGQTPESASTWVVHFVVKSPEGTLTRNDLSAIEQMDYWLHNKLNWTTHNPSVTITYKPHEIVEMVKWIWDHKDVVGGMAFLPSFDASYAQLPYIEIGKDEYERRAQDFPAIDFSRIFLYEESDMTTAAQELACAAGVCEL